MVSCQEWNPKKVSSEEIYSEERKRINWREVDEYPVFEDCQTYTDKEAAKCCFEKKVAEYIYTSFGKQEFEVTETLNDTLLLYLAISETGNPQIDSLVADSLVKSQIPNLEELLQQSVDSLPKIYPASKRGIPVETVFKLPILISVE